MKLDESFWSERYDANNTGWDIGYISTPLKEYIDQLADKNISILIPGAGNSYEAEYLHLNGFRNVTVIDIAKQPLDNLHTRVPDFPSAQLMYGDFFELNNTYDLIIEQTFFSALNLNLRTEYIDKMHSILKSRGKLVGLLFNDKLFDDHPPFGGFKEDYIPLFEKKFKLEIFEESYNSIEPRQGKELFIKCRKA